MKKIACFFIFCFLILILFLNFTSLKEKLSPPPEIPPTGFILVVLPDTQYYSRDYPNIFLNQTQWIVNNKKGLNIVFVSHTGDIVQSNLEREWVSANNALSLLDDIVPYGMAPGNHDNYHLFNHYFPYARYQTYSWYGRHYDGTNNNSYQLFSAGGMNFIILHLEYDPTEAILKWANKVLADHPDRRAIAASHNILNYGGFRTEVGQRIFAALKDNPHLFLLLSGHVYSEERRTDMVEGRPIHQVLANYQTRANGGNGWMRLLKFVPEENKIYVKTYSPYLAQYEEDENSQFELEYAMGANNF